MKGGEEREGWVGFRVRVYGARQGEGEVGVSKG